MFGMKIMKATKRLIIKKWQLKASLEASQRSSEKTTELGDRIAEQQCDRAYGI